MRSKSKQQEQVETQVAVAHPDDPDGLAPVVMSEAEAAKFETRGWSKVDNPEGLALAGQKVPEGDVVTAEELEEMALAHQAIELVPASQEVIDAISTGGVPLTEDQIPVPVQVLQFDRIPGDEDPDPLPPIIIGPAAMDEA